jgi:hypothetical protein
MANSLQWPIDYNMANGQTVDPTNPATQLGFPYVFFKFGGSWWGLLCGAAKKYSLAKVLCISRAPLWSHLPGFGHTDWPPHFAEHGS